MKLTLLFTLIYTCVYPTSAIAQTNEIDWLSFEELTERYEKEQKPILIFLYTDWCKFCKMQENTTFKDTNVINKLNKHFYCLRFNAEKKEPILFFEREYKYSPESGFHELAVYLGSEEGKLRFPTSIILNAKLQLIYKRAEAISKEALLNAIRLDSY